MASSFFQQFLRLLRSWWRDETRQRGLTGATTLLLRNFWEFARDSTPERRRQRYGDMEYDWDHRVDTTGGTVGWRTRLVGLFLSPYQATDPALFHEMMASLQIKFEDFTFVDLGSGKGRTLLMASEYPFRKVLGVEMIPELNRAAEKNVRAYRSPTQRCLHIESILADAREFEFPEDPLVLYLFNPLPQPAFSEVLLRLKKSLERVPRKVWIVYHNPVLERLIVDLGEVRVFSKVCGTEEYSIYSSQDSL